MSQCIGLTFFCFIIVANSAKERKQIISESKRELESLEERINEHKQSIQDADVKQVNCLQ